MVRCIECARTVNTNRTVSHGDSERKYRVIACSIDRAATVLDRWRWCDGYRAKNKRADKKLAE